MADKPAGGKGLTGDSFLPAKLSALKAEKDLIVLLKKRIRWNSKMLSPKGHAGRVG